MLRCPFVAVVLLSFRLSAGAQALAPESHVPARNGWERRAPHEVGLDPAAVDAALQLGRAGEIDAPRDMRQFLRESFAHEPHHRLLGPVFDRGSVCGVIVRRGYLVAEWGDVARADMCNSVTKTFLSTVVGLLWQRGLIRDVGEPAAASMPAGVDLFASEHNRAITWDHLLRQTSGWQGELWGIADWQDRPEGKDEAEWRQRTLHAPGARFEYNDVRVNALALAALHVSRRPLPAVLRDEVMDPIGASSTWRWHGYDNAWIELDGARVQSVSGGGHFGAGLCISTLDLARFGLLMLRDGCWGERRIVSSDWLFMACTPGAHNPGYGFGNWFLNGERKAMPAAPATAVRFLGNGGNVLYVDRENDLVVVARWLREPVFQELLGKLLAGLPQATRARDDKPGAPVRR